MPQLISVGQLIDQSWETYRSKLRPLLRLSAWLLIPGLLGIISIALQPDITAANSVFTWWQKIGSVISFLNRFLITPIIGLWVFILLVKAMAGLNEKKSETFSSLSHTSWKLFLPCVLVNLIIFGIFIATWLTVLPGLLINWSGFQFNISTLSVIGTILTVLGVILATVLSIRWLIDFAFAPFFLIIDHEHGKKAIKKSRELILGRFWPTLFRLLIVKIVFIAVFLIIEGLLSSAIDKLVTLFIGLNINLLVRLETIGLLILLTAGSIFFTPLITLVDFLLFNSLKETKK
ncbi:MAG: hypothetical protein V1664_02005 [Candidatus Uhrbacteria bacterium]